MILGDLILTPIYSLDNGMELTILSNVDCVRDCNGACCKCTTDGNVPFTQDELKNLNNLYDEELAKTEYAAYTANFSCGNNSVCRRLTEEGLCWFQTNGLYKPVVCRTTVIAGDSECLEARKTEGFYYGAC